MLKVLNVQLCYKNTKEIKTAFLHVIIQQRKRKLYETIVHISREK